MIKYPDRINIRWLLIFFLAYGSREIDKKSRQWRHSSGNRKWKDHISSNIGNQVKEGSRWRLETLRDHSEWCTSSSKALCSITSPNRSTNWKQVFKWISLHGTLFIQTFTIAIWNSKKWYVGCRLHGSASGHLDNLWFLPLGGGCQENHRAEHLFPHLLCLTHWQPVQG